MEILNQILGVPLGYIMYLCFVWLKNYGLSILLFTIITKILLFPLSLLAQKNSITMVRIQPLLADIKQRYAGNSELIMQEQRQLYKEEKYSTLAGILPLLLQIPLILGLINVIYNPLQHLLRLEQSQIDLLAVRTRELLQISELGFSGQLQIMEAVQNNPAAFASLTGQQEVIGQILAFDFKFFGLNLSALPLLSSISILVPLLSGLSALLLAVIQNRINVLQKEQSGLGRWGMAVFLTLFSAYFAFVVPAGIGVYWIFGNLLAVLVAYACNWIYDPRKLIDYSNRTQTVRLTRAEKEEQRKAKKLGRQRERQDSRRFFAESKQLAFYSESSGFFKYFTRLIDYLLEHSDLDIHYVTSDPQDQIFQDERQRIKKYYIGPHALIPFMMKLDADMLVMTMPDLDRYHIKRSIVRKDVEYVYLDHGMSSLHLTLRENALDHFDTIFCNGPNHVTEIRQMEEAYGLPAKTLVKTGYGLLETLLENVAELGETKNEIPHILIAPSWQKDNLLDFCLAPLLAAILGKGYRITLRPHPEYVKRFPAKMKQIKQQYAKEISHDLFIEDDFSGNFSIYTADILITDWSTIASEFSYATLKPSLFINTPMKVMNPNYKKIAAIPLDISLRDEIGVSVDPDQLADLAGKIDWLLQRRDDYREQIKRVRESNIYNIGSSAAVGGQYIIETLHEKKLAADQAAREYQLLLQGIDPADKEGEV